MVRLVLFDVDGTLVHTGRAGSQAFAKTFATEFNARDGIEKIRFAGRTDVSLVREFFSYHNIPATPENFQRFFTRFVFWLDQMVAQSHGGPCRGVPEFLDGLRALPNPPMLGLLTGNIRLGAEIKLRRYGLWDFSRPAGSPTTTKTAIILPPPHSNVDGACWGKICGPRKSLWSATRHLTSAAGNSSARKCWPWPPAARSWTN